MSKSITKRQNDKAAIKLLKASYRCLRNERIAKYVMLVLSFGICLVAIFNRYLPNMASGVENITDIQEAAAVYINLISGVILVVGLAVGFYTHRMHVEGTVLRDRYDAYVFDNPPNLAMLRPIPQTVINVYAQKTRRRDAAFSDMLYKPGDDPDPETAQFNYINGEAHSDYRLYISIQPFFLTLWIGFCVIIIILGVAFDSSFVTTLINIMIPSLSAITTIGNSWYNCRLQMKQLQNLLAVIDQIQRLPDEKRLAYIKDKKNMRALADGLYNYRVSAFVIPNFLVRRHLKTYDGDTVTLQLDGGRRAKTEMPTLVLPDVGDTVPDIANEISGNIRTVTFSRTRTVDDVKPAPQRRRYTSPKKPAEQREQKPAAAAKPAAAKPAATAKPAAQKATPAASKPAARAEARNAAQKSGAKSDAKNAAKDKK